MSGSDVPTAGTVGSYPPGVAAPGGDFPRVRRLACWQVRRAAELLRDLNVDLGSAFGIVGYGGVVEVPHYEERHIIVVVIGDAVLVFADGPQESPHRYGGMPLCMWHPDDPLNARWTLDNGIDDLLYRVRNHLFREAWWRDTREWLGAEASHRAAA